MLYLYCLLPCYKCSLCYFVWIDKDHLCFYQELFITLAIPESSITFIPGPSKPYWWWFMLVESSWVQGLTDTLGFCQCLPPKTDCTRAVVIHSAPRSEIFSWFLSTRQVPVWLKALLRHRGTNQFCSKAQPRVRVPLLPLQISGRQLDVNGGFRCLTKVMVPPCLFSSGATQPHGFMTEGPHLRDCADKLKRRFLFYFFFFLSFLFFLPCFPLVFGAWPTASQEPCSGVVHFIWQLTGRRK